MRRAFFIVLVLTISISAGFLVFGITHIYYAASESQSLHDYKVKYGEGIEAKDLGIVVNINLSFVKIWFVGGEMNVTFEVSAEKFDGNVQNFSWRIFWIELFTVREGKLKDMVAHGSFFLNESEWNEAYLSKRQNIPVDLVNLNYLESAANAWFRIGIMMDIYHNNTEYSLTSYTPVGDIGPVAVLSPLYTPISLATISTAAVALLTTLTFQLLGKIRLISKKRLLT